MNDQIKQDVIATAQLVYNQLSTFERVRFINQIRGLERTYKNLDLDKPIGRQ